MGGGHANPEVRDARKNSPRAVADYERPEKSRLDIPREQEIARERPNVLGLFLALFMTGLPLLILIGFVVGEVKSRQVTSSEKKPGSGVESSATAPNPTLQM
jgi:hypothetical protein